MEKCGSSLRWLIIARTRGSLRSTSEAMKGPELKERERYITSQAYQFQKSPDQSGTGNQIGDDAKHGSESCDDMEVGEEHLRQRSSVILDIADLRIQYQFGRFHVVGARVVASLALGAECYPLVHGFNSVKPEPLCIRACLLWPRILGIGFERGTLFHANRTSDAALKA